MTSRAFLILTLLGSIPVGAFAQPVLYTVDRADVVLQVRERGVVAAATVADLAAPSITLPGNAKFTIKWLIEDGSPVRKGDKVLELDDGALREQLQQQQILVAQAAAGVEAAERELKLNEAALRKEVSSAEAGVEIAELLLKNADGAEALAKRRLELKVRQATIAIEKAKLELKSGATELARLNIEAAEVERESAATELKQFEQSFPTTRKQMELRLREARGDAEIAKLRGEQRIAQARAATDATRTVLAQEKARLESLAEDVKNCVLHAPMDGLLVYYASEANRLGPAQTIVAVGEPVQPGRRLVRVVDLTRFNIETRVAETQVSRVRAGQDVQVRVDAFPQKPLTGKVQQVATVASQVDWQRRDAKVYATTVSLTDTGLPLKPGMTAEIAIDAGAAKNALRIPQRSVIVQAGRTVCQVQVGNEQRRQAIVVGLSDGNFVEVKEGLKEGDKVVVPPKADAR